MLLSKRLRELVIFGFVSFCVIFFFLTVQLYQIHVIPGVFFLQWLQEEEVVVWAVATSSRNEDNFGLVQCAFFIRGY